METVADAAGHLAEALRGNQALEGAIEYLGAGDGPPPGDLLQASLLARAIALLSMPVPSDVTELVLWVALLRDCDLWHAPICTGAWTETDGASHERANARLSRHGRLNSNRTFGSIVTRHAVTSIWSSRTIERANTTKDEWPNSILSFITFIPSTLTAHEPDFGSEPTSGNQRPVDIFFSGS